MLGETPAVLTRVVPLDVHGVRYVDITVRYRDGATEDARLGRESVPSDIVEGDDVLVSRAVNMIVAVRRP